MITEKFLRLSFEDLPASAEAVCCTQTAVNSMDSTVALHA